MIFGLITGLTDPAGSGTGFNCLRDLGTFLTTGVFFDSGKGSTWLEGGGIVSQYLTPPAAAS